MAAAADGDAGATGILILDETSFPKSGPHSVGVARQYCGALGKVANCQVAVTAALWTGGRAWPMGASLYLPEAWTRDPARRARARIPAAVTFHEKWRLALTLLRRTRAAGITLTAVVADAEYGDNSTLRRTLHRLQLPYALGISPTLTVFRGTPTLRVYPTQPPPRNRRAGWPDRDAVGVRALSDRLPPRAWRRVAWRNGTNPPWEADFAALRVTPATDWRQRRLAPEIWLLCERGLGPYRVVGDTIWSPCRRPPRCHSSCAWRISAGPSSSITKISKPNWASIISRAGRIPAGSITWRSARSPMRFSRPNACAHATGRG